MRGRLPVAIGLAAVVLVVPIGAQADPKPTVAQARAKLKKLNAEADQLVDRYNAANEKWKKAKKQYGVLNADYSKHVAKVEVLRQDLVAAAVSSYQTGDLPWSGFFSPGDPTMALSSMATLTQYYEGRAMRLEEYENAFADLKRRRDQRKDVFNEAAETRADLKDKKEEVDKLVDKQTELLRDLGAFNSGNTNSPGLVYSGSASGNALAALQFAYKQIGKPYRYGGTGPGSWDCSGLVQASWAAGGVNLPRTSYEMWAWGASRRVSLNDLQAGDLLWRSGYGHVAMYAGDGKVVHAPQTGDVIKVVTVSQYNPIGAVRP